MTRPTVSRPTTLRVKATHAARLRWPGQLDRIGQAALDDLEAKGIQEDVYSHVFDYAGTPVVVYTRRDGDGKGIFIEFDDGRGVPRRTLLLAAVQHAVKGREKVEADPQAEALASL